MVKNVEEIWREVDRWGGVRSVVFPEVMILLLGAAREL